MARIRHYETFVDVRNEFQAFAVGFVGERDLQKKHSLTKEFYEYTKKALDEEGFLPKERQKIFSAYIKLWKKYDLSLGHKDIGLLEDIAGYDNKYPMIYEFNLIDIDLGNLKAEKTVLPASSDAYISYYEQYLNQNNPIISNRMRVFALSENYFGVAFSLAAALDDGLNTKSAMDVGLLPSCNNSSPDFTRFATPMLDSEISCNKR